MIRKALITEDDVSDQEIATEDSNVHVVSTVQIYRIASYLAIILLYITHHLRSGSLKNIITVRLNIMPNTYTVYNAEYC